jgi:transposase
METGSRTRKKYEKEFIIEAVKLVVNQGRTVADVAQSLGIHENQLYRWRRDYLKDPENAFPGKGHMKPAEAENYRLRKELANMTMERDILKKVVAIFSKTPK